MNIQQFDFSIDLLKVVKWEYDQAPNLRTLLGLKQDWYTSNHEQYWTDWERDVFNLLTANDFGLNVWSIILNLPLYAGAGASRNDYPAFGFASFGTNFDNGNFARDASAASRLSLEQKRSLLRLRWWQITSDGSMPSINRALNDVFGDGVYVLDSHNMTMNVVYQNPPSNLMISMLKEFDLIPRPSGVKINHLVRPKDVFGFADYGLNFDQINSQFGN